MGAELRLPCGGCEGPSLTHRLPFQGEKGEPGAVFGPDGRALAPSLKGAKVSRPPGPGFSPLVQGGAQGFQGPWRQRGQLSF